MSSTGHKFDVWRSGCVASEAELQPGDIFKPCDFVKTKPNLGAVALFEGMRGRSIDVNMDRTTAAAQVATALKMDCIATHHTGRTIDTILSVVWVCQSSVVTFALGVGISWKHIGMEHIVANVYMCLRTSCFGVREQTTDTFFCRASKFLCENFTNGMDHFAESCSHRDSPSAKPSPQPPRSTGNALHRAAQTGSVRRTERLLEEGTIDVDEGDSYGYTPLILAAYLSHRRVVLLLLRAGANVSAANDQGYTALAATAKNGDFTMTAILVNAGADVNARYGDGRFPLYHSTANENVSMVNLLLQSGADGTMPVKDGQTPLHLAAAMGHRGMVLAFINAGVNLNVRMRGGDTPLVAAAQRGHTEVVTALLAAGADASLGSTDGGGVLVALDFSVGKGNLGMVRDLLLSGNGIERCGGESKALNAFRFSIRQSYVDIAIALSGAGVVDDGSGLMIAVNNADRACVVHLLQMFEENRQSMDPRYLNAVLSSTLEELHGISAIDGCRTPLTLAARQYKKYSSIKIAQHLIERGADTEMPVAVLNRANGGTTMMTPSELVEHLLHKNTSDDDYSRQRLQAMGRLLHRVDAIRGASWLWPLKQNDQNEQNQHLSPRKMELAKQLPSLGDEPDVSSYLHIPSHDHWRVNSRDV